MNSYGLLAGLLFLALATFPAKAQEADQRPQLPGSPRGNIRDFLGLGPAPDAAAAKLGEPLYKDNCATCHGPTGRGAQGPNLVRSALVLHDEKGEEIGPVVKQGRPQGGMPAFSNLQQTQLYDIAEYLHLQVELAANRGTYRQTYSDIHNQVTGDPARGKAFFAANCSSCHSVTGDLAKIGSKYPQPAALLTRIAWPTSPGLKQATVHSENGRIVTGTLLESTDFDVSLRDDKGDYYNWPRDQVKVDVPDPLAGHRALLPKYTDADLHNLIAYLVTLK